MTLRPARRTGRIGLASILAIALFAAPAAIGTSFAKDGQGDGGGQGNGQGGKGGGQGNGQGGKGGKGGGQGNGSGQGNGQDGDGGKSGGGRGASNGANGKADNGSAGVGSPASGRAGTEGAGSESSRSSSSRSNDGSLPGQAKGRGKSVAGSDGETANWIDSLLEPSILRPRVLMPSVRAPRRRGASKPVIARRAVVAAQIPAGVARGHAALSASVGDEAAALSTLSYRQDRLLVRGLDGIALNRLAGLGFPIVARTRGLLGSPVYALSVPPGMASEEARRIIGSSAAGTLVERDAIYRPAGDDACAGASCATFAMINWRSGTRCTLAPVIGMIDTAVDLRHPALAGQTIESMIVDDRGDDDKTVRPSTSGGEDRGSSRLSRGHGTAIATLIAGRADGRAPGLMPNARLVAIDAFHRGADGTDQTDAVALIAGIEALADRGVQVINLSLAGPPSDVVRDAVRHASARGIIIVAAAGNDGPGRGRPTPAPIPRSSR